MFKFSSGSCGSGKLFGKAREDGAGAPTARPAYVKEAVKKLKTMPGFADLGEDELTGRAEELTDPGKLWSVHLSGLVLDPARDRIGEALSGDDGDGVPKAVGIKLQFVPVRASGYYQYGTSPLTSLLMEQYGPIRASILVGGGAVVLEWNTSGLVIPAGAPIPAPQSARDSSKCTSVSNSKSIASAASSGANPATSTAEEVISYEFESATAEKERLDKLIDIVVRYNRNYLYHPILRNCQKFAADCLVALGYPIHPKLAGRLGDYFAQVKKTRKRKIDFFAHEDLDKHIGEFVDSIPEDAEYLLTQYFMFHVTSLTESDRLGRWVCEVPGCRKAQLELRVDLRTTVAYRMFGSTQ